MPTPESGSEALRKPRINASKFKEWFQEHLEKSLAKNEYTATELDRYMALALAIRGRLFELWMRSQDTYYEEDAKRVYYLSMEFLMGRTLGNSLLNLGLDGECKQAMQELSYEVEVLQEMEFDAGLGNGGLGRLAACFLDSMATLSLPGYGYGIRYEYGIFSQSIVDGYQIEKPDNWLKYGNPWEVARPQFLYPVHFYGQLNRHTNQQGKLMYQWVDHVTVMAMAYDTPIPGYGNKTVNTLRLWSAKASSEFDLNYFNEGDYIRAVQAKTESESISKVLYPSDNLLSGKELRLKQEYFFVSATLQDILRRYKKSYSTFDYFAEKTAIQLNDTHPAIAIADLMRLLVDEEGLEWDQAWHLTVESFGYTNHTVMPEALERWSVQLLEKVLPRHLQIIYDINHQFLLGIMEQFPDDFGRCVRMSIIEEAPEDRKSVV